MDRTYDGRRDHRPHRSLIGQHLAEQDLSGEADALDRVGGADPDYGRAYAAAIPGARFHLLPATGHVPQIESPALLLRAIRDFASAHAAS